MIDEHEDPDYIDTRFCFVSMRDGDESPIISWADGRELQSLMLTKQENGDAPLIFECPTLDGSRVVLRVADVSLMTFSTPETRAKDVKLALFISRERRKVREAEGWTPDDDD